MSRVLIIGGGLAGSVLAVRLARRGEAVDVFERHPDGRSAHGIKRAVVNITLCERGLRAMAAVGMRDAVLQHCVAVHGRRIHAADGTVTYQPYGNAREAIYSISRADLNSVLVGLAERESGVRFHFNQKCIAVDLPRATAQFEDARTGAVSEVQATRIFGADGAYSTVRLQMQKTDRFNYSQQYWSQGYTSLKIPPRTDGTPALESGALHIWPRGSCMLIGFPNRDSSITCSLLIPFRGANSYESLSNEDRLLSFFRAFFGDAVRLIPDLAEQFFARPSNSILTVRCDPWSFEDKILLIGDAAHAVLPSYGQGANAAFEDCSVLDECIENRGGNWRGVFLDFEQQRKSSMDTMADLAIEHFVELSDLVGDPKFLKRREIERRLHELYPSLYQPLYSMVTFGTMSYADAIRIDRRQRALIDSIMLIEGIESKLDSAGVRRLLEESASERA